MKAVALVFVDSFVAKWCSSSTATSTHSPSMRWFSSVQEMNDMFLESMPQRSSAIKPSSTRSSSRILDSHFANAVCQNGQLDFHPVDQIRGGLAFCQRCL